MMSEKIEFRVNDNVVYSSHGVGTIIGEEIQSIGGMELKVFVIQLLKENMILRIPVKRAADVGLRPLSSPNEFEKVLAVLLDKPHIFKDTWSRRVRTLEAKINSGDIFQIAEVVRDLYKNVHDPDRSYSERVIYESAFERLIGEYSVIKGMEQKEAKEYINEILADNVVAA
jgi:CarD family transcriptional regulator